MEKQRQGPHCTWCGYFVNWRSELLLSRKNSSSVTARGRLCASCLCLLSQLPPPHGARLPWDCSSFAWCCWRGWWPWGLCVSISASNPRKVMRRHVVQSQVLKASWILRHDSMPFSMSLGCAGACFILIGILPWMLCFLLINWTRLGWRFLLFCLLARIGGTCPVIILMMRVKADLVKDRHAIAFTAKTLPEINFICSPRRPS